MNLPHRPPLHLSELTSVLNIWLRKHHRKRGKAKGPTGASMEVESDPAPGGKALPLTPAEQQEAAARMDELQRQLAREQETREKQNAEYEAVVAENDQLKTRLTQLDSLPHQVKDLQKKREHEQETAHKGWELYEGAAAEAQQLKARVAQLEEEVKQSEMRVSELEQAHAHSERERRTSIDLLETRTNELRAAQVFLKNDEITDDEIMHLVDTLNAQVAKTAAAIAPASQFRFESVKDAASMEKAVRRIEHYSWLSPHLLSLLRTTDHTRSTTLVQTALQAGMIMYARWLATSWELGVIDPRGLLEGLYFQMREREPQSVAGRWRALTRAHVKALLDTGETQTQRLFKSISGIVADVLVICGVAGTSEIISETVGEGFATDLHEIVSLALQFQWTAGERIVSRDFVVYTEEPDAIFDSSRMEDERAESKRSPHSSIRKGRVLCTTQLGLIMEKKVGRGKEEGEVMTTVLTKPKVVLKTGIDRS